MFPADNKFADEAERDDEFEEESPCSFSLSYQKVHISMIAGNMIAKQLDASAPISEINRSSLGMKAAKKTVWFDISDHRLFPVVVELVIN